MQSLLAENGTQIMAWGPMAQGKNNFFTHEVLTAIGEKYGKTASQTGLRFLVQQGIPVIPKSTGIARMEENLNILDFTLSDGDMSIIRGLNLNDCGTRDYTSHEYASKIISQVF